MTQMQAQFAPRLAAKLRPHPETIAQRARVRARTCRCRQQGTLGDYMDPNTLAPGLGDDVVSGEGVSYSQAPTQSSTNWLNDILRGAGQVIGQVAKVAVPIIGTVAGAAASRAINRVGQGSAPNVAAPTGNAPSSSPVPAGTGGLSIPYSTLAAALASQQAQAAPVVRPQPQASGIDSKTLLIGGGVLLAVVLLSKS